MDDFNPQEEKLNAKEVESTPVDPKPQESQNQNSYTYTGGSNFAQGNSNGTYYVPKQAPAQPKSSTYYTPPVNNHQFAGSQNSAANDSQAYLNTQPVDPLNKPKKKKSKALIAIIIVVIVCVALAVVGLSGSSDNGNGDSDNNSIGGIFEDEGQKDDATDSQAGTVTVKDSNEASKKDEYGNLTAAGVAEVAMDSCVGIEVYTQQDAYSYFYGYGGQSFGNTDENGYTLSGEGSGVIMSEANGKTYIMTCAHVIDGGDSYTVILNDGTEHSAKFVGADGTTDIGVLVIEKTGLKIAEFGNSEDIEIGEDCVAIGCPGGLEFINSVTKGIVSALARPISSQIGYDNECLQIDAAINPGNSGGALFNMQGQVIGINSSKIADTSYEGMGFAVPSNTAVKIANALIKDGYVSGRAKLGITYNTLQNYNNAQSILTALEQKGFKDAQGTMVIQSVDPESDLSGKGIKQYDMIVAVNGETMTSVDVMTSVLSQSKPGDTIELTIARVEGNSIKTATVKCLLIESKD